MLVTVTGGTGFVGSHSIAELLRANHKVRMLVRNEAGVERALSPLGVNPSEVEVAVGDVTDEASVKAALRGADAVLHGASVFSFDSRDHRKMKEVNANGTEIVLSAARAGGVGRIVYVSSIVALMPSPRTPLSADSPVGKPKETYFASKADAEVIARRHQDEGAPIAITYPPALLGPNDPHVGDQLMRLRNILRGLMPMWPTGGFPIGDVRDTAKLHAALLSDPSTVRGRYFGPNSYLRTRDYVRTIRQVTGRAVPSVYLPAVTMLPVGMLVGLLQRMWPFHIPAEYGAIYTAYCRTRVDEAASTPLGITARPTAESVADTVRFLHEKGLLSKRQAGKPASSDGNAPTKDRSHSAR
jgi:nucleoside-diphosphate-sugar epimerase